MGIPLTLLGFFLTQHADLPKVLTEKSEFLSSERQNIQQSKEIKELKDECDALKKRLADMEKQIKLWDPKRKVSWKEKLRRLENLLNKDSLPAQHYHKKRQLDLHHFSLKKGDHGNTFKTKQK